MFKIADQFGATDLRQMALTAWEKDVTVALRGKTALRLARELWDVNTERVENLRDIVINEMVQNPTQLTTAAGFREFLGRHPDFALQLIKGQQKEVITLKKEQPVKQPVARRKRKSTITEE